MGPKIFFLLLALPLVSDGTKFGILRVDILRSVFELFVYGNSLSIISVFWSFSYDEG